MKRLTRQGLLIEEQGERYLAGDDGDSQETRALKRLQAAAGSAAHERKTLERLCRYITRPALANERVRCNGAGQVMLKVLTPLGLEARAPPRAPARGQMPLRAA